MPRATIALHTGCQQGEHLDIFIETDSESPLTSYRASAEAAQAIKEGLPFFAHKAQAHRRLYLDYHGEVSGGRGEVSLLWQGEHALTPEALGDQVHFRCEGQRLYAVTMLA